MRLRSLQFEPGEIMVLLSFSRACVFSFLSVRARSNTKKKHKSCCKRARFRTKRRIRRVQYSQKRLGVFRTTRGALEGDLDGPDRRSTLSVPSRHR